MPIVQRRLCEAKPVAHGYPAGEWRSQAGPADASLTPAGQLGLFPSPHYSCLEAIDPLIPGYVSFSAREWASLQSPRLRGPALPLQALSVQISDLLGEAQRIPFGAWII